MPIFGEKSETSITIKINQLVLRNSSTPFHDDATSGLAQSVPILLELIREQLPAAGASEAARALRKQIKHSPSIEAQISALALLEILLLNSGTRIAPIIARDEKLYDVLKGIVSGSGRNGNGSQYPAQVRDRTTALARGWKHEFKGLPEYKQIASLHNYIPPQKRKTNLPSGSASPSLTQSSLTPPRRPKDSYKPAFSSSSPTLSHKDVKKKHKNKKKSARNIDLDKKFKIGRINYTVEAPKIRALIARCHTAVTSLTNLLASLPPSSSLPLDDHHARKCFDECKRCRSKVLSYLQFVGAGDNTSKSQAHLDLDAEFLGSLISANEQLLKVFTTFDAKCGIINIADPTYGENMPDNSDESYYTSSDAESVTSQTIKKKAPPPPPPMAAKSAFHDSTSIDEANPFADHQEITPSVWD